MRYPSLTIDLIRKYLRRWLAMAPPMPVAAAEAELDVHLLCCSKDVSMATAGLMSFALVWQGPPFALHIHSDGSLSVGDRQFLEGRFPGVAIHTDLDASRMEIMSTHFPKGAAMRHAPRSVMLRKLLDPYCLAQNRPILMLDSDILWFRPPTDLIKHLEQSCPYPLVTRNNSKTPFTFNTGRDFTGDEAMVNTGVVLYRKEHLNCGIVEEFLGNVDLEADKNAHFVEQVSFALALQDFQFLPYERYTIEHRKNVNTICRHYTGPRRGEWLSENLRFLFQLPLHS